MTLICADGTRIDAEYNKIQQNQKEPCGSFWLKVMVDAVALSIVSCPCTIYIIIIMKPLGKVHIQWSPKFAYAIGLLTTDGSLSKSGRHVDLTSKDREQLVNFMTCLNIRVKIGKKINGLKQGCLRIQFGDVLFYKFLLSIGLFPNKTKTLGAIKIPQELFFDFLRGHLDGDGSFYSYFDPRWRASYMFYTVFISASKNHILWLQSELFKLLRIRGYIKKSEGDSVYNLRYAKAESLKLLPKLYYNRRAVCLSRKRIKIEKALAVSGITLK